MYVYMYTWGGYLFSPACHAAFVTEIAWVGGEYVCAYMYMYM